MAINTSEIAVIQPWTLQGGAVSAAGRLTGQEGRPSLLTPAQIDDVMLDGSGELLPCIGQFTDPRRVDYKKFELPAAAIESDAPPASDTVGLTLYPHDGPAVSLRIELRRGLSRLPRKRPQTDSLSDAEAPIDPWRTAADAAERMTDIHLDLVNHLYDSATESSGMFWDLPGGGVGVWPLPKVIDAWRAIGRHEGPDAALIVRLAERLPRVLAETCRHPRRGLTRQRIVQDAGRICEIDATCLRWLARQSGVSVAEKVGVKQQAMGIARVETADTLENRLVRDLLARAGVAADAYLDEHRDTPDDPRLGFVRGFRQLMTRLLDESPIGRVSPLRGVPTPNYVLQHDPRYRPLYKAYVMLIKADAQRQQAWRWRQRIWSENCQLALFSALLDATGETSFSRSHLLIRPEQSCGRFIDPRSAVGRIDLMDREPATTLQYVDGRHLRRYRAAGPIGDDLGQLCPDAVMICRDAVRPDKPPRRILAVWSLFDFDLDADQLEQRCKAIATALRLIRTDSQLAALVIQPGGVSEGARVDEVRVDCCVGLRVPLPLQLHEPPIHAALRQLLELPS